MTVGAPAHRESGRGAGIPRWLAFVAYRLLGGLFLAKPRVGKKRAGELQRRVSNKIDINMGEMKAGRLHSGSKTGPLVKSRKQAIAISYSQASKGKG